jgi:protein TonB
MRTFTGVLAVLFLALLAAVLLQAKGAPRSGSDAGAVEGGEESAYLPVVEVMPEPVGGIGAIIRSVVYPDLARKSNVEGKVYLVAYINEQGGVDDVKIIKGLPAGCEEAAVKAVKEAKFSAGKQGGVAVKSQLSIPIQFKLK